MSPPQFVGMLGAHTPMFRYLYRTINTTPQLHCAASRRFIE